MAPELSSLPLAAGGAVEDAALSALDIAGLRLTSTRTVVLSACDSGSGPQLAGDGPLSLARAFLSAGTPTVVASLWPVPDEPTAPLITSLHQRLRAGDTPAAALRAAQLALLRSQQPSLRSPAVWSVFEAFGG
jgi:CHAT domain-containing protein